MRNIQSLAAILAALLIGAACSSATDFPDPSNPVRSIPWPDYELLRYDITDQTGTALGTVDFEVERDGDEYQFRVLFLLPDGNVRDETFLHVAADTLTPLRYERLATNDDDTIEVNGVYGVDAEGAAIVDGVVIENGDREEERISIGEFAFDTESSAWLWRTIDFRQDYEVSYRSVNIRVGRSQLVRLRVVGQDFLGTPAGDFVSWQVEARPGLDRQNIWYAVDDPHLLVRWDLEPRRYTLREVVTERAAAR